MTETPEKDCGCPDGECKKRMFPLQDSSPITWEEAEIAYSSYCRFFGPVQTLEELKQRGGFSKQEFKMFTIAATDERYKGINIWFQFEKKWFADNEQETA